MYFRKNIKLRVLLKATKGMLKLILIFKSVLRPQAFLVRRTHFLQLKQLTYFLSIIQWKTGWNKNLFFKKGVMYELRSLFI